MGSSPHGNSVGKDFDEDTFSFAAMDPANRISTSSYLDPTENTDDASGDLSPADILFFKGQLVPHPFPSQSFNKPRTDTDLCRSGSYTTSISKSDSLASSRGNSSRSSNSSSRNGSSRQNSAKRQLGSEKVLIGPSVAPDKKQVQLPPYSGIPVRQRLSASAAPTVISPLKLHRRRNSELSVAQESAAKASGKKEIKGSPGSTSWLVRKIFRPFVSACRECHALEPDKLPAKPQNKIIKSYLS
ncbi:uncharacterized protein [Aristolochia californica]|uniref:uncharacterized protein n=1 Tax=Aristolochia californica TaxID=171875 RepID=UPI0035D8DC3D